VDEQRLSTLARKILADVLSVGTIVGTGPSVAPVEEEELLRLIQSRLRTLFEHHHTESDEAIASRFRSAHPELFRQPPPDDAKRR